MNFGDEEEQREKKLAEMRKQHQKMKADAKIDDSSDSKVMDEIKAFLNKDMKIEDSSKVRE